MAAIAMMFAAFTSALIVRQRLGARLAPPYPALDSLLEHAGAAGQQRDSGSRAPPHLGVHGRIQEHRARKPARWLYVTLLARRGLCCRSICCVAAIASEGIYLATNPNSSFFYLLTAVHALHVLGGLVGMTYVIRKLRRVVLRRSTLDRFCVLLAFHGHSLGVFACAALDEGLI